jgi:hypothetical protein
MCIYIYIQIGSINSCYQTLLGGNQMCHTETMECILQLDKLSLNRILTDNEINGNFGFTIQGPSFVSDILMQPPVIGYLEPGGVAERY